MAVWFPAYVTQPLPRKHEIPIIDSHIHLTTLAATTTMIRAGRMFGVAKFVGICRAHQVVAMRKRFGDLLAFNVWHARRAAKQPGTIRDKNVELVRRAAKLGARCIKFWFKPQYNADYGLFWDDPRLDPTFELMVEHDLPALVHMADPDIWWKKRYADPTKFESKTFTYRQLTNTLRRFPSLRVVVPHMGGDPERLDHLERMLTEHRNLYLDTSATKWIAREFSAKPEAARDFLIRWADRLMWGTDLVPWKDASFEHHCSRYWVHQFLLEGAGRRESPIPDPDNGHGKVTLVGLDLPVKTLKKLYHDTAVKFYKLDCQS